MNVRIIVKSADGQYLDAGLNVFRASRRSAKRFPDRAAAEVAVRQAGARVDLCAFEEVKAQGFAAMSPEKQAEIASKGGKSAHVKGTAHKFDSESGKAAARMVRTRHPLPSERAREMGAKGGRSPRSCPTPNPTPTPVSSAPSV